MIVKSAFFRLFAGTLSSFVFIQLFAVPDFTVSTDKPEAIYQAGETAVFTISAKDNGKAAANLEVMYAFRGEKNLPAPRKLTLDAQGEAKVAASLDHPGQLQLVLYLPADKVDTVDLTGKNIRKYYGAVFSPEKLRPVLPAPADFNEFWDKEKAAMQSLPLNAVIEPVKAQAGFKAYSVCLDAPEGNKAYGYLTVPADARPGSLPVCLRVFGAGTYEVVPAYKKNLVIFTLNPHALPNGKSKKFYAAARRKLSKLANGRSYMYFNENCRTKSYFLGMYRRDYRAMQFLASRPEWNGRDFIVSGRSQGGGQALVCAGLEPRVTQVYSRVTAMCDWGGFLAGRESGWPYRRPETRQGDVQKLLTESAYFDAVNFARNIRSAKCVMATGFSDIICKATSDYAAFNVIPSRDKKMISSPVAGHSYTWSNNASYLHRQ